MSVARFRILGIFAHPDDESMGPGATLAKYARLGHHVSFVTATEGGAGRLYEERPTTEQGLAELRSVRRQETAAAAQVLGIESLGFLGWEDGALRARDILEVEETFAGIIRKQKPDVVITFHGSGISYHPDHRVITLAVQGAFQGAADPEWYTNQDLSEIAPHRPERLFTYVPPREARTWIDWPRAIYTAPSHEITTRIDTRETADLKWAAIEAHASQQFGPPFRQLYEAGAFLEESFVQVFPTHQDHSCATDLLAGLDAPSETAAQP